MEKVSVFALVACIFFMISCTHRLTDFTIISTKNVDLSRAGSFKRTSSRVNGRDMVHIILGIPTGNPNLKEAIDRAIETTRGAVALVDGVVYTKAWWALLYGQAMVIVEGSPLIDPSLAMMETEPKESFVFMSLDKNGKIKKQNEITPEEFNKIKANVAKHAEKASFKNSMEITAK